MNITILCAGKLKERFWVDACAEYLKRLQAYAKVSVKEIPDIDPAKAGGDKAALEKEADAFLDVIPKSAQVILLAIEGKLVSSEDISDLLDRYALHGESDLCFIIGSSNGVSRRIYDKANRLISFGKITMPHNMARVVLLEQLYRGYKISRGEPYHK